MTTTQPEQQVDAGAAVLAAPARPELPEGVGGEGAFLFLLHGVAERLCEIAQAFLTRNEPEATHQFRVALRRHRSLLRLFAPYLEPEFVRTQTERAREIGSRLSPLRQLDVLSVETLPALAAETRAAAAGGKGAPEKKGAELVAAGFESLAAKLRGDAARKRVALKRSDLGVELCRLLLDLQKAMANESWRGAGGKPKAKGGGKLAAKAQRIAGPALDRALRKLRRYGDRMDALSIEERHEMRKKAKTLRYAVEFFGSLYEPDKVKPYRRALKQMQESFGALNDAADAMTLANLDVEPALRPAIKAAVERSAARMQAEFPTAGRRWRALAATPAFWR